MKIRIVDVIICSIAVHLLYSNSELLILTKKIAVQNISYFEIVLMIIFAFSYSLITALALRKLNKFYLVAIFAVLDGISVYLRINIKISEYFIEIVAIFLSIYTGYIIIIAYILEQQEKGKPIENDRIATEISPISNEILPISNEIPTEIENIKTEDISLEEKIQKIYNTNFFSAQKSIAKYLNTSEAKVCRVLKNKENGNL